MIFDTNQTEFVNDYQRDIWEIGIQVIPLNVSLADIADPDVRTGCAQVYQCTMEILTDMYENTTQYEGARPLDYLLFAFEWTTGIRKVPAGVKKNKGLYEHILEKLGRFGFDFGVETRVSNTRYPLFIKYWCLLQKYGNPQFCDFRVFTPGYKPMRTYDDLIRPLSDQEERYARDLYDHALDIGAKRLSYNKYKPYAFVYQKKHVLVLSNNGLLAVVPYKNQYTAGDVNVDLQSFIEIAKRQPDSKELLTYIQQEIVLCRNCSNINCSGLTVDVAGVKRRVAYCHTEIGKVHSSGDNHNRYTDYDIAMLKRMMDIRMIQIDESIV